MTENYMVARVAVSAAIYAIDKPYDYYVPEKWRNCAILGQRVMVPFGAGNKKSEGFIVDIAYQTEKRRLKYIAHIFDDEIVLNKEQIALSMWMSKRYLATVFESANAQLPPGMWNKTPESYAPAMESVELALQTLPMSKIKSELISVIYGNGKAMTLSEISKAVNSEKIGTPLTQLVKQEVLTVSQKFNRKVGDKTILTVKLNMPIEQAITNAGNGKPAEKRIEVLKTIAQAVAIPEKELCYLTGAGSALIRNLEKRGIVSLEKAETFRRPKMGSFEHTPEIVLSQEQQTVFDTMNNMLKENKMSGALLHGVTGSGKTSVYIKLIREALNQGKSAILLVPEIALTPQAVKLFCLHFKDDVAVMHSSLTGAQRLDEYKRIQSGKATVVIGTRSAVFAPLKNLGIIIIDEEQETTYKSETTPKYNAIEVAKYRCFRMSALLVLGSATPSVETYFSARCGNLKLLTINNRYNSAPLPQAIISDMRGAMEQGDPAIIGNELREELCKNIKNGQQSILFINRRGNSRMVACVDCGYVPMCPNCSTALTYHSKNERLMCHHCGYSEILIEFCPKCGSRHIKQIGAGTQKIEEELIKLFPNIKVIRMDADTTTGRTTHEKLLEKFVKTKADVLVGTQMIAKGLDFDNVTLVGVLDADLSLYCGDYHGQERTFSLLAQVVGRAGRRQTPGRAVIQTYNPQNPIIQSGAKQDYDAFYQYEIMCRQAINAPPYGNLYVFSLSGINENEAMKASMRLATTLKEQFETTFSDIKTEILGPVPAPIARVNKRYRFTVAFRGEDGKRQRELAGAMLSAFSMARDCKTVSISVDMNPYSM